MQASSNKCHVYAEGVVALWETLEESPRWASIGNQGADKGKGPSCACSREPLSLTMSFQHLILEKLNVLITVEMHKEMVSIMALHMLRGEFRVVIDNGHNNVAFQDFFFFCCVST